MKHAQLKTTNRDFVQFKDEDDKVEYNEGDMYFNSPCNLQLQEKYEENRGNIANREHEHNKENLENEENGGNQVLECELSIEVEDQNGKNGQKQFKFEESAHSADNQDSVIYHSQIDCNQVAQFQASQKQSKSFESLKMNSTRFPEDQNQQKGEAQKRCIDKQLTIMLTDPLNSKSEKLKDNAYNSENMEEGSTKFTTKTSSEQFTVVNMEKKISSACRRYLKSEGGEEEQEVENARSTKNIPSSSQNNLALFEISQRMSNVFEPISNRILQPKLATLRSSPDSLILTKIILFICQKCESEVKPQQETIASKITNYKAVGGAELMSSLWGISQCEKGESEGNIGDGNFGWNRKAKTMNELGNERKRGVQFIEKRYCGVCFVDMPVRTKHCKRCNRCIAQYDHHCPWVGNCIGERNKCVFYWFLLIQNIQIILAFKQVLEQCSFDKQDELIYNIYVILTGIVMSFFFLFVTSLFIFHSFFGAQNITTWEYASWEKISYLNDIPQDFGSPFSMGLWKNCISFCTFRLFQKRVLDYHFTRYPMQQIRLENQSHQELQFPHKI